MASLVLQLKSVRELTCGREAKTFPTCAQSPDVQCCRVIETADAHAERTLSAVIVSWLMVMWGPAFSAIMTVMGL